MTRPALDSLADLIGPDAAIKAMDWFVRDVHDLCDTRDNAAKVMVENDKLPPPSQVAIDSYAEATADLRDWAESRRYELWLELRGSAR